MPKKRTERLPGLRGDQDPEAREHRQNQTKWFALLSATQKDGLLEGKLELLPQRWLQKRFGARSRGGT